MSSHRVFLLVPRKLERSDGQIERMKKDLEAMREFKREFLKVHKHTGFD